MKKAIPLALLLVSTFSFSQVGIGTSTPHASAQLDVTSTTKGFLPPRMTQAQRNAIAIPIAAGLQVWCSDCGIIGQMQVFNGTIWKGLSVGTALGVSQTITTAAVTTITSTTATCGGSILSDGGEAVTARGVCWSTSASPTTASGTTTNGTGTGEFTSTITGLSAGITYYVRAYATNSFGTSYGNEVVFTSKCGALVSATVFKEFACHNLGADTSLAPNIVVQGIFGNYYQWGRLGSVGTQVGITGTWNTSSAANGAWIDTSKTANDPCLTSGFRVPTSEQWTAVIANNTITYTNPWVSGDNFGNAVNFGPATGGITLTLPAAGDRVFVNGGLYNRGNSGYYWSSTASGAGAGVLSFSSSSVNASYGDRCFGYSVRCVSE